MQGCRCDSGVVPLAQGIGLQPGQFYTAGRAGEHHVALPDMSWRWGKCLSAGMSGLIIVVLEGLSLHWHEFEA